MADPLVDLAWFCNGICDERFPDHVPEKALYNVGDWPTRQELMAHYAAGTGRSMASFDYYLTLAMFKGGCILEYKVEKAAKGREERVVRKGWLRQLRLGGLQVAKKK